MARSELLESIGIEVAAFGPTSIAVQRFPSLLVGREVAPEEFLAEVIDKLSEEPSAAGEHLLESLLQSLACKAAVKAGAALSADEMQSLLAQRELAEKASACPHGRPTVLKMTLKELEKQFKRT
jgi:DNA mismatch repair protein MutL